MILAAVGLLVVGGVLFARKRAVRAHDSWSSRLLLELASSAQPEEEWPRAMLAEHDSIEDRGKRTRFARGALIALGRTPPRFKSTPDLLAVGLGIIVAAALAVVGLLRYPGLRVGASWIVYSALFVLALVSYLLIALFATRFGTPRDHLVGALVGAIGLPTGVVVSIGTGQWSVSVAGLMILLPAIAVAIDAAHSREEAVPWVASVTCTLTAGLAFFSGFVTATLASNGGSATPTLLAEQLRSGIHPYATWAVGDAFGGACFMLAFTLVVGGLLGLGVAALTGRRGVRESTAR